MAVCGRQSFEGSQPGELSVERVMPYELIVNLKTARDIGVTVPPKVLNDRVMQKWPSLILAK
jgi:putative ABC transport system substrate-binding protein